MADDRRAELVRLVARVEKGLPVRATPHQHRVLGQASKPDLKAKRRRAHLLAGLEPGKGTTKVAFSYDAARVEAVSEPRLHAIPGFDRKVFMRPVIRVHDMDAAMGVGIGTTEAWRRRGDFPRPLGHYLMRSRKVPAYTMQEALTYLMLLATETGGEPTSRPFRDAPDLKASLLAARDRLAEEIDKGGKAEWRMRYPTTSSTPGCPSSS